MTGIRSANIQIVLFHIPGAAIPAAAISPFRASCQRIANLMAGEVTGMAIRMPAIPMKQPNLLLHLLAAPGYLSSAVSFFNDQESCRTYQFRGRISKREESRGCASGPPADGIEGK